LIEAFNLPDGKDSPVRIVCLEVATFMAFKALFPVLRSFLGNFLSFSFVFILLMIRVKPERVESSGWSS